MDQVAMPETGGIQRPGHPPVIHLGALQFVDRPRRSKHPPGLATSQGVQATKGRCPFLQFDQVALAGQRQFGQRLTRRAIEGIDPGQRLEIVMRRFLGVRHLARQLVHQVGLALFRIAGLERIVIAHFKFLRFFRLTVGASPDGSRNGKVAAQGKAEAGAVGSCQQARRQRRHERRTAITKASACGGGSALRP